MKRKLWQNHLLGAVLAFLFSISVIGCLVTGWDLPVLSGGRLFFWCGFFSVLSSLLLYFRYGWCGILLLSLWGAFVLWQDGALWEQLQSLACTVSTHFRVVYGWPVIGKQIGEETDLVLILLAYLAALPVSCCICRRKHIVIALPFVLLPLVLCLITTDTLPDGIWLWLMMLGIVLLLVTDWVRRRSPGQFASLTLWTAVPAAAALALLFALNPQEAYVNHAAVIQQKAVDWFGQIKSAAENVVGGSITDSFAFQKLSLRSVGPKSDFTYTVMRITSSYGGTVYLRGRDYDIYTGTMWESSGGREEVFPAGADVLGNLTINTNGVRNVLYTPYHSAAAVSLIDGFAENGEKTDEYSYTVAKNPAGVSADLSGYTDLPPETYRWADELAGEITEGQTAEESRVQAIADYVENSASYDLSTSAMDPEYTDFARWFLEESDTGYCVHFATAAAVLLRAAGIPARYVEGYAVICQAGAETLVSNKEAHAWVEYYDSDEKLWKVLDATPGGAITAGQGETEETETEPEETAESEESETEEESAKQSQEQSAEEPEERPNRPQEPSENAQNGTAAENTDSTGGANGNTSGTGENPGISGGNSGSTGEGVPQKTPFVIPGWAKTLAWILSAVSLIPVQGYIRIAFGRKRWNTGTPNEMALVRWKMSGRLARLTKTELPTELEELAYKAKFSQHTITAEELDRFRLFRRQVLQKVGQMPWYRKIYLRWILAVG